MLRAPARDRGLADPWDAVDKERPEHPLLIKLLPAGVRASEPWPTVVERLGRLGNPQLPRVVEGGELPDGRRWLALGAVEGRSLANWLEGHTEAGTSPGLGVVLRLFDAVSRAVQVGHGAGGRASVLHRGLSPRSVILKAGPGGHQVRVLDHELAPFLGGVASREHMAPEQEGTSGRESAATDVFSLAAMLVQLLLLRATPRPDSRETWWELVRRTPKQLARKLAEFRSDVPSALWEVIAQAMHADPERRFADAQSFARKLRQAIPAAWKALPAVEREPPVPTQGRTGGAQRQPRGERASVPVGWVDAERPPAAASAQAPATVAAPEPQPRRVAPELVTLLDDDAGAQTLIDDYVAPPPAVEEATLPLVGEPGSARADSLHDEPEPTPAVEDEGVGGPPTDEMPAGRPPAPPAWEPTLDLQGPATLPIAVPVVARRGAPRPIVGGRPPQPGGVTLAHEDAARSSGGAVVPAPNAYRRHLKGPETVAQTLIDYRVPQSQRSPATLGPLGPTTLPVLQGPSAPNASGATPLPPSRAKRPLPLIWIVTCAGFAILVLLGVLAMR